MTDRSDGRCAKRIKRRFASDILYDYNSLQSSPDFVDMFPDHHGNDVVLSEVIPDDLLAAEILPRLADSCTALRSSAVSKLWHSLIAADNFIPNFLLHRRRRRSDYAMFVEFRIEKPNRTSYLFCTRYLISEGLQLKAGVTADCDFSRSPCCRGRLQVFECGCDDFILFSSAVNKENPEKHIYLRNLVTGLWLELPNLPVKGQSGDCALVIRPPNSALSQCSFRVVWYNLVIKDENGVSQAWYTIFSSETGRWSDLAPGPDYQRMPAAVATNGLIFMLYREGPFKLLIFDAFGGEPWRLVDLPSDLLVPQQLYKGLGVEFGPADEVEQIGVSKDRPVIGAVQGQLRLGQLFKVSDGRGYFVIKIWELCDNKEEIKSEMWRLVSEVRLRAPPPFLGEDNTKWIYFFAFDPKDSDAVFLCCDSDVNRYCISSGDYQYVFQLGCTNRKVIQSIKDSLPRFAQCFIVRLPPWPTTMPTIPSSSAI